MGKRARSRGDSGKGSRQRQKERRLGLDRAGLSKPLLDRMNEVSMELYGIGIGVIVQEEERLLKIARSFDAPEGAGWFERRRARKRGAQYRDHAAEFAARRERITREVADGASVNELDNYKRRVAQNV